MRRIITVEGAVGVGLSFIAAAMAGLGVPKWAWLIVLILGIGMICFAIGTVVQGRKPPPAPGVAPVAPVSAGRTLDLNLPPQRTTPPSGHLRELHSEGQLIAKRGVLSHRGGGVVAKDLDSWEERCVKALSNWPGFRREYEAIAPCSRTTQNHDLLARLHMKCGVLATAIKHAESVGL